MEDFFKEAHYTVAEVYTSTSTFITNLTIKLPPICTYHLKRTMFYKETGSHYSCADTMEANMKKRPCEDKN